MLHVLMILAMICFSRILTHSCYKRKVEQNYCFYLKHTLVLKFRIE